MSNFFGKRIDAQRGQERPLRRRLPPTSPRPSAVQRVPSTSEAVAKAATAAWNDRNEIAGKALSSSLRFIEFLRAYMAAFGAGFATYLLLSELTSGHFNILAMIGTHLLAIIAAPFYALMLAPAIFGIYSWVRIVPVTEEVRVYLLGMMPGALLLLGLILHPRPPDAPMVGMIATILTSGLVAAHAFNRSARRIRTKRDAAAN